MGAIAPETKCLCTREAVTDGRLSDVFCTDDILERRGEGVEKKCCKEASYVDVGEQRQKGKPERARIESIPKKRELRFPIENERIQEKMSKRILCF